MSAWGVGERKVIKDILHAYYRSGATNICHNNCIRSGSWSRTGPRLPDAWSSMPNSSPPPDMQIFMMSCASLVRQMTTIGGGIASGGQSSSFWRELYCSIQRAPLLWLCFFPLLGIDLKGGPLYAAVRLLPKLPALLLATPLMTRLPLEGMFF